MSITCSTGVDCIRLHVCPEQAELPLDPFPWGCARGGTRLYPGYPVLVWFLLLAVGAMDLVVVTLQGPQSALGAGPCAGCSACCVLFNG